MIDFLFWNVGSAHLESRIATIAFRHDIDVIMLAESTMSPANMLRKLNGGRKLFYYHVPKVGCEKIDIFSRFSPQFIPPLFENDRTTIRHLKLPGLTEILLVVTHLPSKLHWTEASQAVECFKLADAIRNIEQRVGHSRTVIVGDLNMNPFEDGVVSAGGLHGVLSRRIAATGKRTVQGIEYGFFYNPMWNFLGDRTSGPSGTFYYNNAEHKVFFWNVFDQVLIRPELVSSFKNEALQILDSDGETSLLSPSGLPDRQSGSDHLPIRFALAL